MHFKVDWVYKVVLRCAGELAKIEPWQVTQKNMDITYRDSGDAVVITSSQLAEAESIPEAPDFKANFELALKELLPSVTSEEELPAQVDERRSYLTSYTGAQGQERELKGDGSGKDSSHNKKPSV